MVDVRMPDGTIIRNVPPGTTKAQLQAKLSKKKATNPINYGAGDLATSKLSLGISDRVMAGADALIRSGIDAAKGDFHAPRYTESQNEVDRQKAAYKAAHPGVDWATLPLNLMAGGSKLPGLLAEKIGGGAMRQAAGVGAAFGAGAGVGNARGDLADQAGQIGASTMFGAITGPIAAKVVPWAIGKGSEAKAAVARMLSERAGKSRELVEGAVDEGLQNVPDPQPAVRKIIQKALAAQGMTPKQAGRMLDEARSRGVPLGLMDTGDEMRGLASALSRKPGASRTIVRDSVVGRQEGQLDRVQGAIQRDLGPVANVRQTSEQMISQARAKAAPLYDKAYGAPVVSTPELESLLNTPAGRQALNRARVIAANERRDPAALGFALDDAGNVVLNPVNTALHSDAATARSSYDDAVATAKASYDNALASLANQRRLAQGGAAKGGAVAEAQRLVDEAQHALEDAIANNGAVSSSVAALSAQPMPGVAAQTRGYTTHTLDYVKRGLDDVVESMRDPVTGRLRLDEAGRAINDVRAKLVRELDRLNPDYEAARSAYAGQAQMNTALAKGSKIGTKDAETIWAETRDMSPAELDQYKLGVRSALSKMLEGRPDDANKVRSIVGTPKKRAVMSQLFGGDANFERFMATLADEGAAAATHGRVAMGSPTASNLADDATIDGPGGIMANMAARALTGRGMIGNAIETVRDAMRYGAGKSGEVVRSQLASGLSETDPVMLAARLRAMEAFNKKARFDRYKALKRSREPAAAGGIMGGYLLGGNDR